MEALDCCTPAGDEDHADRRNLRHEPAVVVPAADHAHAARARCVCPCLHGLHNLQERHKRDNEASAKLHVRCLYCADTAWSIHHAQGASNGGSISTNVAKSTTSTVDAHPCVARRGRVRKHCLCVQPALPPWRNLLGRAERCLHHAVPPRVICVSNIHI